MEMKGVLEREDKVIGSLPKKNNKKKKKQSIVITVTLCFVGTGSRML